MRPPAFAILTRHRAKVIGGLTAVAALHCFGIFGLYRGRVVAHWSLSDSDLIVFLLPTLAAFVAYLVLVARAVKRIWPRLGLSALLTLLSAWAGLIVSFNAFGT